MPYKTGSWGQQAKKRSKQRRKYFREYRKKNPQVSKKRFGIDVPTELVVETIQRANGLCEVCGEKGQLIHHIDGNHTYNIIENLMVLCKACHTFIHKFKGDNASKKTKEMREYMRKYHQRRMGVNHKN